MFLPILEGCFFGLKSLTFKHNKKAHFIHEMGHTQHRHRIDKIPFFLVYILGWPNQHAHAIHAHERSLVALRPDLSIGLPFSGQFKGIKDSELVKPDR